MSQACAASSGNFTSSCFLLLFSRSVVSDSLQPHNCSTPGFPVLHHLLEFAQTDVHWVKNSCFYLPNQFISIYSLPYNLLSKQQLVEHLNPQEQHFSASKTSVTGNALQELSGPMLGLPSGRFPSHRLGFLALVTTGHCGFLSASSLTICIHSWAVTQQAHLAVPSLSGEGRPARSHVLAVWPWTNFWASLGLHFLIYKLGVMIIFTFLWELWGTEWFCVIGKKKKPIQETF